MWTDSSDSTRRLRGKMTYQARIAALEAENARLRAGPQWTDRTPVEEVEALRAELAEARALLVRVQQELTCPNPTFLHSEHERHDEIEPCPVRCAVATWLHEHGESDDAGI